MSIPPDEVQAPADDAVLFRSSPWRSCAVLFAVVLVAYVAVSHGLWMKLTSKPGKVGVETVIEVAGVKKVGGRRLPNRKDPGKMEFFFPTPP